MKTPESYTEYLALSDKEKMKLCEQTLHPHPWISCKDRLPKEGDKVETKIHDEKGSRNENTLCRQGCLWFLPDFSMYVYYTPTHWRLINEW
jgi:hypothetical protein